MILLTHKLVFTLQFKTKDETVYSHSQYESQNSWMYCLVFEVDLFMRYLTRVYP